LESFLFEKEEKKLCPISTRLEGDVDDEYDGDDNVGGVVDDVVPQGGPQLAPGREFTGLVSTS
jgi:hypothetical protein